MHLLVLRHGEAVDAGEVDGSDRARVLTGRGRKRSEREAAGLGELELAPECILTSPYPRAEQTARIVAEVLKVHEPMPEQRLEPGATVEQAFEAIEEVRRHERVMVVGHNPGLEDLVSRLIGAGQGAIRLRKGGCALMWIEGSVDAGCGLLEGLWTWKQLARQAGD